MGVDTFLARQPIFDSNLEVYGYELLHRTGDVAVYDAENHDQATIELIHNSLLVNRLTDLTGGRLGFINITQNLLFEDFLDLLSPEQTVLELLETIRPEPRVIAAIRGLKARGHTIALDDYTGEGELGRFVALADIIKIDFLKVAGENRRTVLELCRGEGERLFLAEKVETREDFEQAREYGYSLFQGYFFSKPETKHKRDLPQNEINYLRLLREINRHELDLEQIESVIKSEMSLSAKLLRYLNSAQFGVRAEITSIRQAMTHLGQRPLRRWASVVALACLGNDKPQELVVTSMARAHFCEQIASTAGTSKPVFWHFLAGMFSMIDALLDWPLEDALRELGLPQPVEAAIEGDRGTSIGRALALVLACERGDHEAYSSLVQELGISEEAAAELYAEAIFWADGVLAAGLGGGGA